MGRCETLAEALSYDADNGTLTWREPTARRVKAGDAAGNQNPRGYVVLHFRGRQYYAHRVAWLLSFGRWPEHEIDHINGDKADNRLCNLREASRSQNELNTPRRKVGQSGYRGVWPRKGNYRAYVSINGRQKFVGTFKTAEEAAAAYNTAAIAAHGSFATLNKIGTEYQPHAKQEDRDG